MESGINQENFVEELKQLREKIAKTSQMNLYGICTNVGSIVQKYSGLNSKTYNALKEYYQKACDARSSGNDNRFDNKNGALGHLDGILEAAA